MAMARKKIIRSVEHVLSRFGAATQNAENTFWKKVTIAVDGVELRKHFRFGFGFDRPSYLEVYSGDFSFERGV